MEALFIPTIQVFFGLSFVIALMGGAWMIQGGVITIGMLTTFTLYSGAAAQPDDADRLAVQHIPAGQRLMESSGEAVPATALCR